MLFDRGYHKSNIKESCYLLLERRFFKENHNVTNAVFGSFREGRRWAIAVRRGSYECLFFLKSGFLPRHQGNSVLNFGSLKAFRSLWYKFFPLYIHVYLKSFLVA